MSQNERTYRQLHPHVVEANEPSQAFAVIVVGGAVVVATSLWFLVFLFLVGFH